MKAPKSVTYKIVLHGYKQAQIELKKLELQAIKTHKACDFINIKLIENGQPKKKKKQK